MAIESSPFEKARQVPQQSAERIVDTTSQGTEDSELSLRPKRLSEYIGQNKIKEQLGISLTAAKMRGEALDHLLLHGPPGLGKTSLAHV
ncbi:MAG: Holliday junction branch migration DNA helicase RuvB, partial [Armatimonadaceae bacterium]